MTTSLKNSIIIGALAILCTFGFAAFAFAAGSNGSFENGTDPGSFTTVNSGDGVSITDWTVGGNGVDYIGSYWQSSNGSRNIDLNALAAGSVSQTLATVAGATYTVTFDLSGNPDSVSDQNNPWWSPSAKVVRVGATGAAPQDYTFDTAVEANDKTNMKWKPQTYTFVATGASTVLSFESQTAGAFGPAIDNVQIAEQLPQACTAGTLTLTSGTNTQFKGMTTVDPSGSSADGLFTGGTAAAVVTGPDGFPGAWDTAGNNPALSGASWVNNNSIAPSNPAGAGGDGTVNSWRLFSQSFALPAGAIVSSANVSFSADNSANAFYDNASIGSVADFQTVATVPFSASTGSHELEFVTKNDAYNGATNPTAVIYKATINYTCQPVEPAHPKVVIAKFIDGVHATAGNADSAAFPMTTTWTSTGPNGNVTDAHFTLSPAPWGGIGDPYEATYINGVAGDNYATNEITTGNDVVGASCADGKPFALVGYSTGNSWSEAQNNPVSLTIPSFSNLQSDKYVIVWNHKCPVLGSVSGMKFWDVNGNGVKNVGEPGLSGWTFTLSGPTPGSTVTGGGGAYTFGSLAAGAYTMNEVMQAGWTRTTALPSFTLAAGENKTGVDIGNACFVSTGGKGKGYWTNKNGEATMKDGGSFTSELSELSTLNLRNANGTNFDPATYAAYSAWNSGATATNMAYMLSAQLSALYLSREAGFINGSKQIVITDPALAGISGMSPLGVITINDLIADANTELGLHGSTPAGNGSRAFQEALKNAVEKAAEGNIQLCMPFNQNS